MKKEEKIEAELFYKKLYEKPMLIDKPKSFEQLYKINNELNKLEIFDKSTKYFYEIAHSYVLKTDNCYGIKCVQFTFVKADEYHEFIKNNEYEHYTSEKFLELLKKVNKLNKEEFNKKRGNKNNYIITFDKKINYDYKWVSVSSIEKDLFYKFIDYLYDLKRPIIVDRYNCGKMYHCDYDFTFSVKLIVKDINDGIDKDELLTRFADRYYKWQGMTVTTNPLKIYFSEDVYEFYKSLNIPNKIIVKAINKQYKSDNIYRELISNNYNDKLKEFASLFDNEDYYPYVSRWKFIYMFRSEFKLFMKEQGKEVIVEGGWVLNDKLREMALNLINYKGELI